MCLVDEMIFRTYEDPPERPPRHGIVMDAVGARSGALCIAKLKGSAGFPLVVLGNLLGLRFDRRGCQMYQDGFILHAGFSYHYLYRIVQSSSSTR